jgi:hypothetical protein
MKNKKKKKSSTKKGESVSCIKERIGETNKA